MSIKGTVPQMITRISVSAPNKKLAELLTGQGFEVTPNKADANIFAQISLDQKGLENWLGKLKKQTSPAVAIACVPTIENDYVAMAEGLNVRFVEAADLSVTAQAARIAGELHFLNQPAPRAGFFCVCSPAMKAVIKKLERFGKLDAPVLIRAESGSGKELCAKLLNMVRDQGEMLAINCAALKPELIESELFGHRRGSFSGAVNARKGLMVEAKEGTLFLDEIGELRLDAQAVLLRVLEEKKVRGVGENEWHEVLARVVLATHRDLEIESEEGRFRSDLYYRITPLSVMLPPLRERKEEIPLLVSHFIKNYNEELGLRLAAPKRFCSLFRFDWPGNIRQLQGWIYEAMVLSEHEDGPLDLSTVEERILALKKRVENGSEAELNGQLIPFSDEDTWKGVEERARRIYLTDVYRRTGGNKKEIEKIAGYSRSTLYSDLKRLGIGGDK